MAQDKKVKLYTLSTCAVCHKVERFFEEHGIAYERFVVDELDSGEQWLVSKELKRHNPQATYPTVVVEEVIKGFDEERLKEALAIR
ncbi:MAG: glutaredoxin family protein [Dissulfurispiraceae bacterium]